MSVTIRDGQTTPAQTSMRTREGAVGTAPTGTHVQQVDLESPLPEGANKIGSVDVDTCALPTNAATEVTLSTVASTLSTIASGIASMVSLLTDILDANTITNTFVTSITAANTTANVFADQPVKGPVHIKIGKDMVGTLTIDDGDAGSVVLSWDDTNGHHVSEAVFYPANLNQLRYTFSQNAITEVFSISTGI